MGGQASYEFSAVCLANPAISQALLDRFVIFCMNRVTDKLGYPYLAENSMFGRDLGAKSTKTHQNATSVKSVSRIQRYLRNYSTDFGLLPLVLSS